MPWGRGLGEEKCKKGRESEIRTEWGSDEGRLDEPDKRQTEEGQAQDVGVHAN